MKEVRYCDLRVGDEFKLQPNGKFVTYDLYGHRTKDRRVLRKTNDGALEIIDCFGNECEEQNFRHYPYLTMPVWIESEGKTNETNN